MEKLYAHGPLKKYKNNNLSHEVLKLHLVTNKGSCAINDKTSNGNRC
jgi:hypothetical protein